MGYAIELLFDSRSEQKISKLINSLESDNIYNKLKEYKSKPHIALSVFDNIEEKKAIKLIEDIDFKPLTTTMYGLGTFPGEENIIYLIPKVTMDLLTLQKSIHKHIESISNCWEYYHPENWIPHCTIAMNIAEQDFSNAFQLLRNNFSPITVTIEKINLIKFHPVELLYEKIT